MANILNLPNLNIVSIKTIREDGEDVANGIEAESNLKVTQCPECSGSNFIGHGIHRQLFIDVPTLGHRTALTVLRKRFRCKDCGKTFMEELPDMDDKRLTTKRLVTWVNKRCINHMFASVARDTGLHEKTVRNMFCEYIKERQKRFKVVTPRWLGIDEVHLTNEMRCVLTNVEHNTAVEMFEYRTQKAVITALTTFPNKDRVELVTMDMWRPYAAVARLMFPQAKVVIDKSHVVRLASDGMESARKTISKELTEKGRKKMLGDRFVLLRHRKALTLQQELKLEGIIINHPLLKQAHEAKESFYSIWDAQDKQQAIELYECWRDGIPKEIKQHFKLALRVMENWNTEIFNYFDHPITNAYTECLNGLIKIMSRSGRGYSFDTLRAKILFADDAHKKMRKPLRASMGANAIHKSLERGILTKEDIFLDLGTHIPTLLKMLEKEE